MMRGKKIKKIKIKIKKEDKTKTIYPPRMAERSISALEVPEQPEQNKIMAKRRGDQDTRVRVRGNDEVIK